MRQEERAERLVRRIESFSDLVIGFSLALLALTLTIPPHIERLATNPWWLIAYFWTFAIIGNLWFLHQRLFTHYFWPQPLTITLNFFLLSLVGLIVYFVQVFVRYGDQFEKAWAFIAYFFVLGAALVALGTLYYHGTRKRWASLDPTERYIGMRHSMRVIVGLGMMAGSAACAALHPQTLNDIVPLFVCVLVAVLGTRLTLPWLKRRAAEVGGA
jgi:uncharacterized membrane protein